MTDTPIFEQIMLWSPEVALAVALLMSCFILLIDLKQQNRLYFNVLFIFIDFIIIHKFNLNKYNKNNGYMRYIGINDNRDS